MSKQQKVMRSVVPQPKHMKYYDLKKNWRHVKRHLADKELNDILDADFNKYTFGLWKMKFTSSDFPSDFETTDWYSEHKGRRPAFWTYVKAHACHWLVNFTLRLAMLVEPRREWRIITSVEHSTVWDGENTIFDFNWQAFGVDPSKCFNSAFRGRELKPGRYRTVRFAMPSQTDRRLQRTAAIKTLLRLTPLLTSDGRLDADAVVEASDLIQFADTLSKKKAAIENQLGVQVQRDFRVKPVQQLGRVLGLVGLRLERVHTRKIKGKRVYAYRLAPGPLARMKAIVQARRAKIEKKIASL